MVVESFYLDDHAFVIGAVKRFPLETSESLF